MKEIQAISYIKIRSALNATPEDEVRLYVDQFMPGTIKFLCSQISKQLPKCLVEYYIISHQMEFLAEGYLNGKELTFDSGHKYYKITESDRVYHLADGPQGLRWKYSYTREPCDD